MLSAKSGWLVKRNEQHVWQRRWCCVVPHMFLYYFEAAPADGDGGGGGDGGGDTSYISGFFPSSSPPSPSKQSSLPAVVENQEMLNSAVRDGLGGGNDDHDERYYAAAATEGEMAEVAAALADPRGPTAVEGSNLQPVGIIDLECYSNVNRTNDDALGQERVAGEAQRAARVAEALVLRRPSHVSVLLRGGTC